MSHAIVDLGELRLFAAELKCCSGDLREHTSSLMARFAALGNTVSASGWIEAMEKIWRSPLAQHRIWLNRGDIGFGQGPVMAWHEQGKGKLPAFLFKPTPNVKKVIAKIPRDDWQRKPNEELARIAAITFMLPDVGWLEENPAKYADSARA